VREAGDFERISLPQADAEILRDLMTVECPGTVVEIGLAYGSSALAVAEALLRAGTGKPRHLILDAYQTSAFARAGWQVLTAAGVDDLCELIEEPSQYALPRLAASGMVADAAFVDGSHIFHNVFVDLYYLNQMIRPNGLVTLDDCAWTSVATAVGYYQRYLGWTPQPISKATRLRAFRLPETQPAVDFTAFTPPNTGQW
jgi:predicted O-methyltransferase YrrM